MKIERERGLLEGGGGYIIEGCLNFLPQVCLCVYMEE